MARFFLNIALSGLMLGLGAGTAAADQSGLPIRPADDAQALREAQALRDLVASTEGVSQSDALAQQRVAPPPAVLTVENGRNEVFPIARHHLNRLTTPFSVPTIKTVSTAEVSAERGGVVYISTEGSEPVTLYITEQGNPEYAISLTLLPRDIPPVTVKLEMEGLEGGIASAPAQVSGNDSEGSYLDTIKNLFQTVARGQVPAGYSMSTVPGNHPLMPHCAIPGLSITPVQVLSGRSITVLVARATNRSGTTTEVNERACIGDGLLAVASWPTSSLAPGQQTELYLAVKKPQALPGNSRPSVIGGVQ